MTGGLKDPALPEEDDTNSNDSTEDDEFDQWNN